METIKRVAPILAFLITIGVAIYFGLRQTPQKSAYWTIDAQGELVNINRDIQQQGMIEISFDGKRAENVGFIAVTFVNSGGIPLDESDFKTPLSLDFGENATIFSAEITKEYPKNLDISVTVELTKIIFSRELINPGESFTVQVIGSNLQDIPTSDVRIVGLSNVPVLIAETPAERSLNIVFLAFAIFLTAYSGGMIWLLSRIFRRMSSDEISYLQTRMRTPLDKSLTRLLVTLTRTSKEPEIEHNSRSHNSEKEATE